MTLVVVFLQRQEDPTKCIDCQIVMAIHSPMDTAVESCHQTHYVLQVAVTSYLVLRDD